MKANKNIQFIDCFVAEQSDKIYLRTKDTGGSNKAWFHQEMIRFCYHLVSQ